MTDPNQQPIDINHESSATQLPSAKAGTTHEASSRRVPATILMSIFILGAALSITLILGRRNGAGFTPTPPIVRTVIDNPPVATSGSGRIMTHAPLATSQTEVQPAFLLAEKGVVENAAWEPYIVAAEGVPMALVPAGCFNMGGLGVYSNETPVHSVCLRAPYWIDVFEVSNKQYASSGYFSGGDLPRETVSWFEATSFCQTRGARLPTEAEWEYAAHGPDNLLYPWGSRFEENYAVYRSNSEGLTHAVGSRPANASWVGALDMSGNVSEWVSSLYRPYPYSADDGREVDGSADSVNARAIRGGSWWTIYPLDLRTMARAGSIPTNVSNNVGFRCARSY